MVVARIELCDRDSCTGCEACKNICPQDCIKMVTNSEGFWYPEINESECVACNLCRNSCPVLTEMPSSFQRKESPKTYASWINDDLIRLQSSSGGLFTTIAMSVLEDGGVVFGAAYDNNMHLLHVGVDDVAGLEKLRRSKYVQSEIGDSYKLVKDILEQGRRVLFVGAPCQVAGLNCFLGKDHDKLITADFICHGVPSPGVFTKYIEYLSGIYPERITDINFRDKSKGWGNASYVMAVFENGKQKMLTGKQNAYFYGFGSNIILRKSCYACSFKKMPRYGDLTIADFWGIRKNYHDEAHKGISCLLINSSRGEESIERWSEGVSFCEESFSKVLEKNKNLSSSVKMPIERALFFKDFNKLRFSNIIKKYLIPPLNVRIRAFVKCRLNLNAIRFIKRMKDLRKH